MKKLIKLIKFSTFTIVLIYCFDVNESMNQGSGMNNTMQERTIRQNGHEYNAVTLYSIPENQLPSPNKMGVNYVALETQKNLSATIILLAQFAIFVMLVYTSSLNKLTLVYCK